METQVIFLLFFFFVNPNSLVPVGGFAYFITAPPTLKAILLDPFHTAFYIMFVLSATTILSKVWVEVLCICHASAMLLIFIQISGTSARGVAKDLKESQMVRKLQ